MAVTLASLLIGGRVVMVNQLAMPLLLVHPALDLELLVQQLLLVVVVVLQ